MRNIYTKLIAISFALALSVSLVAVSSYAWFVLSESPLVSGIQVTIGGGNTILVAPDLTETVDGVTYHYPGAFSDKMNFGQRDSYDYLKSIGGLTPVSTADGINWFLPAYYDANDEEVLEGKAYSGQLKDISEFKLDTFLEHANLAATDTETIAEGSYIYLDFWVVSPGDNYTLRVSTGDDSGGSFLIDLLEPQANADGTYALAVPENQAAAAARVGFLVNPTRVVDDSMVYYQESAAFDERYTELRGNYQEPDSGIAYSDSNRFTIYEPNGDYHPSGAANPWTYKVTNPIALVDGEPAEVTVANTTVQRYSAWLEAKNRQGYTIEQIFQSAIRGKDLENAEPKELADMFYNEYLQGQISSYVDKGDFIKKSENLASYYGTISTEQLAVIQTAGATDDVYIIELERNIPQRIRMFVWLEGQDIDCTDDVNSASFVLNIELAGSNA